MRTKLLAMTLLSGSYLLLCPGIGRCEIIGGTLANASAPGPSGVALNIMYSSINIEMDLIAAYYQKYNKCPAADLFLKQSNHSADLIHSVTNGNNCDAIGQFSGRAPGNLQNTTIRMVVKISGPNSSIDFGFRQPITDIDTKIGHNASFLQQPQKLYAWSNTAMGSNFGPVPSAPTALVLSATYDQIANGSSTANSTSSSGGSSGNLGTGSGSATIVPH